MSAALVLEMYQHLWVRKVNASHTCNRVLGPVLIPVYRQAVSPQVTISHLPVGLPLLSARLMMPAFQHQQGLV